MTITDISSDEQPQPYLGIAVTDPDGSRYMVQAFPGLTMTAEEAATNPQLDRVVLTTSEALPYGAYVFAWHHDTKTPVAVLRTSSEHIARGRAACDLEQGRVDDGREWPE